MSRIITFYSYKGGVGRTFALANIAALLARRGKRVLVIDWDLEAPGLHHYFRPYLEPGLRHRGLIHLLHESVQGAASWEDYVLDVKIEGLGPISLLTAGDLFPNYVDLVRSFSWSEFFERHEGGLTLDRWRAEWKANFDFTLLDSRTGITDSGGVCTILLPDVLALVFATNEQSFERAKEVALGVQEARRGLAVSRPPVIVLPVLGRFDGRDEVDDARLWLDRFASDLKPFYDDWLPSKFEPRQMLEVTKIPYVAKFSFGEPLPAISHGISDPDQPGFFFERLTRLLASDFADAALILAPNEAGETVEVDTHWTDELPIYGEGFAGRAAELAALDRAWAEGVRVFVLHAQGGAGKTRVVGEWLRRMRDDGWRGARRVFVHSFYSQGSDERRNASSDVFFKEALAHFGHSGPPLTDPTEKGRWLARLLSEQRGLLVLDGLEPLQHPPAFDQGRLKDPALHSLLLSLASGWVGDASPCGLCVVTSRQSVVELQGRAGRVVVQQPLERLDSEAGAELLRQLQVAGPETELRQASDELRGHAYTLMLLGTYLRDATVDHEIRRRAEIPLLQEDAEHGHYARQLSVAYVRHLGESSPEVGVLRLLGFFDRPAEETLLAALRQAIQSDLALLTAPLRNLSEADWRRILRRLSDLHLIDVPAGVSPSVDSHPLLRESFAEQVRTQFPAAWQAGHQQLFEILCTTTEHRPDTLPGLQPLYQAVVHGCLAGLHEQALGVYEDRILRGKGADGFYSARKLGAIGANLGAVACFFTVPWSTLSPNLALTDQAWLLNEAAFNLRALGRLTEAAEPMRAGLTLRVQAENWEQAAMSADNLSKLELTRGEIIAAIAAGEQAITYADRSGDAWLMGTRTTQADALHQAGRTAQARSLFEDAEARQVAWQPEYPRLYSLRGFQYCELLLAEAERAAWQRWLSGEAELGETLAAAIAGCDAASERATYALAIAEESRWLLDIALGHLTLARAALYKTVFIIPIPAPTHQHITAAVEGLRAAGDVSRLPQGLLTRSWLRFISGDEAGAHADLEEAWEIAERGPMPLFQADILLTRARLFRERAALAESRRLIEKHGYGRRHGELLDAEAAAKEW